MRFSQASADIAVSADHCNEPFALIAFALIAFVLIDMPGRHPKDQIEAR